MKKKVKPWLAVWAVMVLLAFAHFKDVGHGMANTGDDWLAIWYTILVLVIFLGTAVMGGLLLQLAGKKQWSLERIYPLTGLFLGLLYLFVLPPLSAPDEISHYIGAYQLSSYMMGKKAVSDTGAVLVRGTDWFLEDIHGKYGYTKDETE